MTADEVRRTLDDMGIGWDDPLRKTAMDFAERTPEQQNLWLFIEIARNKQSRMPSVLNAVYTTVAAATAVYLGQGR